MAPVITEKGFIRLGGFLPGLCLLYGSVANDTTSFVIKPGADDVNASGSTSALEFLPGCVFLQNKDAEKAPKVVVSYDTTQKGDIATITCASSDDYDFAILAVDKGA